MNSAMTASGKAMIVGDTDELQQVGVLPWRIGRDGERKILLITSRRRGQWITPRGLPMKGDAPFVAASRKAFEEAGIIGDISTVPVTTYRHTKILDDGSQVACRVTVFGMNVCGTLTHWRQKEQRHRRWFSFDVAADKLFDIELAKFVRQLEAEPEHLELCCFDRARLSVSDNCKPEV
ncbi:NUDIX hydrolase [Agrobacterium sp.]|uniref:NUDIX hydrolase n=1 Tax=Agrobacterium sp. TaxID=361 RepID=UPI0028B2103E|nr:NUDIX hydrolase [Agrobacterium sp.]